MRRVRRALAILGLVLVVVFWSDAASYADGGTMVVGAPNTVHQSCSGAEAYSETRTVEATVTGTVTPGPMDVGGTGGGDAQADVFSAAQASHADFTTDGDFTCGDVASLWPSHLDAFTVTAGQTYTVALTVYENATDHSGQTADFGNLLDQIHAATPSGGGGGPGPAPGVGTGFYLDPTTLEYHVSKAFFVAFGCACWIAAATAGLATGKALLP